MFRRVFFAALVSGIVAGVFASGVQSLGVVPLIYEAETLEQKAPAPIPRTHEDHAEEGSLSRFALTLVSNVVSGVGFALVLVGCLALRGETNWKRGALWGMGGFAALSLAPALVMPPGLPGAPSAPLADRQLLWIVTVAATAAGLALLAFGRGVRWKAPGAVFIALPHVMDPLHPQAHAGPLDALMRSFTLAALATSAAFWIVLGFCAGYLFVRREE